LLHGGLAKTNKDILLQAQLKSVQREYMNGGWEAIGYSNPLSSANFNKIQEKNSI
jgi:hypothetical protein